MKTTTAADDILVPEFNSPRRTSTVVVAAFNLTATIMGGGVLSIPYAFSKSGKYMNIMYNTDWLSISIYLLYLFTAVVYRIIVASLQPTSFHCVVLCFWLLSSLILCIYIVGKR